MRFIIIVILCLSINTSCIKAYSSQEVKVVSVTASSFLTDKKNRYASSNIADETNASWCEGKKGDGIGEWIQITYDKDVKMNDLFAINGYGEAEFWQKNNRVKELKISTDKKQEVLITLPDKKDKQKISLPKSIEGKIFTFTIQSVYPGSKHKDTCMAELAVSDFTPKGESAPAFYGVVFKSISINLIYINLDLNPDGTLDGRGSGDYQCGEFDSGDWEFEKNQSDLNISYHIKGEGGETCSPVDENDSIILKPGSEKDKVIIETFNPERTFMCDFINKKGNISIDNCYRADE